jgi:hypothetical protein
MAVLGGLAVAFIPAAVWSQTEDEADRAFRSKRAVLSGFSFVEASAPAATDQGGPPTGKASAEALADPDVIQMKEMRVSPLVDRDLAADIKKTRPLKAQSHAKFGTGVYEKDFGKVRAAAVTILYVPVVVGISW